MVTGVIAADLLIDTTLSARGIILIYLNLAHVKEVYKLILIINLKPWHRNLFCLNTQDLNLTTFSQKKNNPVTGYVNYCAESNSWTFLYELIQF